jgi:hypothetical protein
MNAVTSKEIVEAGLAEGKSADELILDVYKVDKSKGIKGATAEVNKLLIELGAVKSPKQKRAEWEDAVESLGDFDLADAAFVSEALTVAEDHDIPVATAKRYLGEWATELGVTLAEGTSKGRTPSNWPAVKAAFQSLEELDADKDATLAKIKEASGLDDDKKVTALFNRLRKEFGATTGPTKVDALVAWFKEAYQAGTPITRKMILDQAVAVGMTATSGQYYVNAFNITLSVLKDLKGE